MFAINTTDLIQETQLANQQFTREENLLELTPNINEQAQQVQAIQNKINSQYDQGVNKAFNSGIDLLFNLANEEKAVNKPVEPKKALRIAPA